MTTLKSVRAHIVVQKAAEVADWYQVAFGADLGARIEVPDGRFMEIEVIFGGESVMICDEFPEWGVVSPKTLGGTYGSLHLETDDADALWQRAVDAGAEVVQPLDDSFWGTRHGQVLDPSGHRWAISQHIRDVPPDELQAAVANLFGG